MAIEVTELQVSQDIGFEKDVDTGIRRYAVSGVATPLLAQLAGGLPVMGSAFPGKPTMIVRKIDAEMAIGDSDLCYITYTFVDDTKLLNSVVIERSTQANFESVWRTDVSVSDAGNIDNDNDTDIGGTHADIVGNAISELRVQTEIQITEYLPRNEFDSAINEQYVGRRNTTTFRGYSPGMVLYLGARSTGAVSDKLELVQHRFLTDQRRFLRQTPKRNLSGNVIVEATGSKITAKEVYWRQPHVLMADLNAISSNF